MNNQVSNRFAWMAFVCAILVVFIHIGKVQHAGCSLLMYQILVDGVCKIAVPFFFMASGYFLARRYGEENWWQVALRKRVQTILIPYVFWNGVTILLVGDWSIKGIVNGFGFNPMDYCALNALWFMRSLFLFVIVSSVLFPLLLRISIRSFLSLVGVSLVIIEFAYSTALPWVVPFEITFSLRGLVFFAVGVYLSMHSVNVSIYNERCKLILCALSGISLVIMTYLDRSGAHGTWVMRPVVMILALCAVWMLMPTITMPKALQFTAFRIYILHGIVLGGARCLGMKMTMDSILEYLFRGIVCVGICVLISHAMNWALPRFARIVFGGR